LTLIAACSTPERDLNEAAGGDAAGGNEDGAGKSSTSAGKGGGGANGGSDGSSGSQDAGEGGGGTGPVDSCVGVVCDSPPASSCTSAKEYQTFDNLGSCNEGSCSYAEHRIACTCEGGACTTDPCVTVTCEAPPTPICADPDTLTTYAAVGECDLGSCSYAPTNKTCAFGCASGACKADPCLSVMCDMPPANKCKNATTRTTYAATGTCGDGECDYAATDSSCPSNQACGGQGVCALCKTDASCGPTCAACDGATPKCKTQSSASVCVGCLSNADCSGANPVCNTGTNTCQARPSCLGLSKTCGPNGNQDCCASSVVTGGTFNRSNEPAYPATVSNFRLDNFEVTVGRFRKFVAAYSQTMIASGAGKNPNNPNDTGWNTAWNASLPADAAALKSSLVNCMLPTYATWTDSVGTASSESLPIDCVTWFAAEAFCIWDGGRLPTEAEWNYAAAGGTAQRNYPWGGAAPDCSYANYASDGGNCVGPSGGPNPVGSEAPKGNGVYGQTDLAGNIEEWVQDWFAEPYPTPCNNCANLAVGDYRVSRGGHSKGAASTLLTAGRSAYQPTTVYDYLGVRCARAP
jgi:formylglycine-generating enzyme required for sulfatase activity